MNQLISSLVIFFLFFSCSKTEDQKSWEPHIPSDVTAKGNRVLGISPSGSGREFGDVFSDMLSVGVGRVELNLEWSYFEEEVGVYRDTLGLLDAVAFYGQNNVDIGLSIATINTVVRTDPEELKVLTYDDPIRMNAFNSLLDWIIQKIGNRVHIDYISVGNEIDFVLEGTDWDSFRIFLESARTHLHENYPGIKVGAKMTVSEGLLGEDKMEILEMINSSDVALLNYYPQDNKFRVHDLTQAEEELETVLTLVDKPIYFTEIGFQSGDKHCNSSEEKQADFYHFLFSFWDKNDSRIPYININWMDDVSQDELQFFEDYYGYSDPAFIEYLATLGLHQSEGSPKYAWIQIESETKSRSW